jgi:hypothetical protein
MSFGKMNLPIEIIQTTTIHDSAGFSTTNDTVLASVSAYKEDKHGSEYWVNNAAFSNVSCLFRFRVIPRLTITTEHAISCEDGRYRILSVEDVRRRHMYVECLADKILPTVR